MRTCSTCLTVRLLHAFGEVVDPWRNFYAKPHDDMAMGHNLGHHNLRNTPWLHRRVDVDYNGWWMCLIPTTVIKEDRPVSAPVPEVG